jgi:putative transposase
MPRRARIMLPDVPVHIVQRGNNRQQCFFADSDRSYYLFQLGRLLRPAGCVLHAYCLMTNHVHLLVTALHKDGCARLMKHLGQLHSQYVNRLYRRSGTLWEGRFRSCLVQAEDYLLQCHRYIESNPVRAGICKHPRHYRWSSYQTNAIGLPSALVTPHEEYRRLGRNDGERRQAYQSFFECDLNPDRVEQIRTATNGNIVLGSKAFQHELSGALGRRAERGNPGRPRRSGEQSAQLDLLDPATKNVVCP